jgi:hypothetical protein
LQALREEKERRRIEKAQKDVSTVGLLLEIWRKDARVLYTKGRYVYFRRKRLQSELSALKRINERNWTRCWALSVWHLFLMSSQVCPVCQVLPQNRVQMLLRNLVCSYILHLLPWSK